MSMFGSIERRLEALEGGTESHVEFIVVDRRGSRREIYRADSLGLSFDRAADETELAFLDRIRTHVSAGRVSVRRGATVVLDRSDLML